MSETQLLSMIADSLLVFAKGIDPLTLPRVSFDLKHTPSDIPSDVTWTLEVCVRGVSKLDDEGNEVVSFEYKWKGEGYDSTSAARSALGLIVQGLQEEAARKQVEADKVALASKQTVLLLSGQTDLAGLWTRDESNGIAPPTTSGS